MIKTTKFDTLEHLKTPAEQIAYLEAALETDDPGFVAVAIGDIARANGIVEFAKATGLSRAAIYKGFRVGGNPTIRSVNKATRALGMKLVLAPVSRPKRKTARSVAKVTVA
jgi:probable addiction module antidote protein